HRGADAVARGAILRRAFEDGVDVAGLARQIAMLSEELESGRQVIEGAAYRCRRLGRPCEPAAEQQREQRQRALYLGRCSMDSRGLRMRGGHVTEPGRPSRWWWCGSGRTGGRTARRARRPS